MESQLLIEVTLTAFDQTHWRRSNVDDWNDQNRIDLYILIEFVKSSQFVCRTPWKVNLLMEVVLTAFDQTRRRNFQKH